MRAAVVAAAALGLLGVSSVAHAGNGTLVVDIVKQDGHRTAADCQIKQGTRVTKQLSAGTGLAQTGLAQGTYYVSCTSRIGSLSGTMRVSVTSGKTSRFRLMLKPKVKPLGVNAPAAGLTGRITDGAGKPLTGKVQITLTVDVKNGAFDAGALPPGSYTVKYLDRGRVKATKSAVVRKGKATRVDIKIGRTRPTIRKPIRRR